MSKIFFTSIFILVFSTLTACSSSSNADLGDFMVLINGEEYSSIISQNMGNTYVKEDKTFSILVQTPNFYHVETEGKQLLLNLPMFNFTGAGSYKMNGNMMDEKTLIPTAFTNEGGSGGTQLLKCQDQSGSGSLDIVDNGATWDFALDITFDKCGSAGKVNITSKFTMDNPAK